MKLLKHAIAFLITAVCLYVAFKGVDLKEALAILEETHKIEVLNPSVGRKPKTYPNEDMHIRFL